MPVRLSSDDRRYLEKLAGRKMRPSSRQKAQALLRLDSGDARRTFQCASGSPRRNSHISSVSLRTADCRPSGWKVHSGSHQVATVQRHIHRLRRPPEFAAVQPDRRYANPCVATRRGSRDRCLGGAALDGFPAPGSQESGRCLGVCRGSPRGDSGSDSREPSGLINHGRLLCRRELPVSSCRGSSQLGHDVVTCQEAGRAGTGIGDETVLGDALAMGRILLTQNRDEFKRLHRKGLPHCGIVLCTYDPQAESLAQRISDATAEQRKRGNAGWQVSFDRIRAVRVGGMNS